MIPGRRFPLLLSLLLLAACDSGDSPSDTSTPRLPASEITRIDATPIPQDERLKRAEGFFQASRFAEASAEYRRVLEGDKESLAAVAGLARVALAMREFGSALQFAERAVQLKPDNAFMLNLKAVALVSSGRRGEAAELFERALALQPKDPSILLNASMCYADLRKWTKADDLARRAGETLPKSTTPPAMRGEFLFRQEKYDQAIPHYRRALELAAEKGTAHYRLGLALVRAGQKAEGNRALQEALKSNPPPTVQQEIRALLAEK